MRHQGKFVYSKEGFQDVVVWNKTLALPITRYQEMGQRVILTCNDIAHY